jgi:hypothetical protein
MKLQTTLHIIVACVVLHNICILENAEFFEGDEIEGFDPELHIVNDENTAVRAALINSVFADMWTILLKLTLNAKYVLFGFITINTFN